MKKTVICFVVITGMVSWLCGAVPVKATRIMTCHTTEGKASGNIGIDGVVSFKGEVNFVNKFGYLFGKVAVEPFRLTGKSLKLDLKASYAPGDAFYVKLLDAKGKVVSSFRTVKDTSQWLTLTCTPGSTAGGVEFLAGDVKADPESEIRSVFFYFCRRGPNIPYDIQLRNISLIPREKKSSLSFEVQRDGDIFIRRIANCYVKNGKAVHKLTGNRQLNYSAQVKYQKYDYLVSSVMVDPFSIAGKSLALDVKYANDADDAFFVKGRDKDDKIIFSFRCQKKFSNGATLVLTPGENGKGVSFIGKEVQVPEDSAVVKLQFYCGRRGPAPDFGVQIKNIRLVDRKEKPSVAGFKVHGTCIESAEVRNLIACTDKNGRKLVLCAPHDEGKMYLLLTELDTGKTYQYFFGNYGTIFGGGVLTDAGKFVFSAGGNGYVFDINTRKVTPVGKTFNGSNLCATVGYNNKVYLGFAPRSNLVEVDLDTNSCRDLGRVDDSEHYCSYLAVDKTGFVYAAIGTARANIFAIDPVSGKKIQLLPEKFRTRGTAHVYAGDDGFVYVEYRAFTAKCLGGKIVETGVRCQKLRPLKIVKYQDRLPKFSDGSFVSSYDLDKRELEVVENGRRRKIKFNYISGGLNITSLTAGPDGNVYFSSSHPHHLGRFDVAAGKIIDLGYNPVVGGGNFCNMTAFNGKLYSCEYAGGRIWSYDPALPAVFQEHKMPVFGIPFSELAANSSARNGKWRELINMQVLLAAAGDDDNELILDVPVPTPGKWYLNMQFFEAGTYGTVTVDIAGKKSVYNLQNDSRKPGKMLNFGPFDLKENFFRIKFNVKKNSNEMSQHLFSLVGVELAAAPRAAADEKSVKKANPEILGNWPNLVTRPRTIAVNPLTSEVVIAGFANYGMVGGGFGVHDLKSGKNRDIRNWLPGESCIDMYFQEDGDLVGSTSKDAPGGGHATAECASVFRMDWPTGKVDRQLKLPQVRNIFGVREFGDFIYAAAQDDILYQIDKKTWQITRKIETPSNTVGRNPLLKTADGSRLFLLQSRAICEIDKNTGKLFHLATPPRHISVGGAIVADRIYFVTRAKLESWKISEVKK